MAVSTIDPNGLNIGQIGGTRNKIINGAMTIDQRNAGAAVTVNNGGDFFSVDLFHGTGASSDGVFTLQQDASAPAGFVKSMKLTVTTADASIGAGQRYVIRHNVEGYNVADLSFGTAGAKPITVSFWVRSSLTGTFGGSVINGSQVSAYPFSFTISAADTWEYKTVTITGDTSGTWLTTNGVGLPLGFDVGCGSTLKGTAGAWTAGPKWGVTGAVDLIATLNATFYLTGVQLEVGDTATPFEHRSYGAELALCQRYYEIGRLYGSAYHINVTSGGGDFFEATYCFKQTKRATPTITSTNLNSGSIATQVADVNAAAFRRTGTFDTPLNITLTASSEL